MSNIVWPKDKIHVFSSISPWRYLQLLSVFALYVTWSKQTYSTAMFCPARFLRIDICDAKVNVSLLSAAFLLSIVQALDKGAFARENRGIGVFEDLKRAGTTTLVFSFSAFGQYCWAGVEPYLKFIR